jgi:hypothetical protein
MFKLIEISNPWGSDGQHRQRPYTRDRGMVKGMAAVGARRAPSPSIEYPHESLKRLVLSFHVRLS